MRAPWTMLALANFMSDGERATIEPEWLAGLDFGSMRAETLENIYQHGSDKPYKQLKEKNETLLEMKRSTETDDYSWPFNSVREAYYNNPKLQRFLQMVPKGNYAHLHFNAYLSTGDISNVYTQVLGDPIFSDADTTDYQELLKTASRPYGDLMDFLKGDLDSRADIAWPTFQGLTPRFKVPFMYEIFWRCYLKAMFKDWHSHKILHGELRHVFLQEEIIDKNGNLIDNIDEAHKLMLDIIRDEAKMAKEKYKGRIIGAKIIYCIPRMFQEKQEGAMKDGRWSAEWHVNQYLKLARWEDENRKDNKVLVAFDIVGREDREEDPNGVIMRSTADFSGELDRLLSTATDQGLPANLALHAGEALDMSEGTMQRRNLELLAELAKKYPGSHMRGAHLVGLEHDSVTEKLSGHSTQNIMEDFKESNVAAELCPISNEALGTSRGARDAAGRYTDKIMGSLCTSVSGDDPTYFGSNPSLELAYILLGSDKVDLYRLIALAHMSINSSYMTDDERLTAYNVVHEQIRELVESPVS